MFKLSYLAFRHRLNELGQGSKTDPNSTNKPSDRLAVLLRMITSHIVL